MLASWPVDAARLGRRQDEVAPTRTPRCDRMSGPRLIAQTGAAGISLPVAPSRIRAIGLRTRHTDRRQGLHDWDPKKSLQRAGTAWSSSENPRRIKGSTIRFARQGL